MNEHDSERIAGLLQADGLEEAATAEDADVVVLNTCCIRENADNKLYGTLGHLKSLKDRSRVCRSPSPAAWPRRTGTPSPPAHRTSTSCSAPTTCTGRPSSSTRQRR